jgi:hypothetical protein
MMEYYLKTDIEEYTLQRTGHHTKWVYPRLVYKSETEPSHKNILDEFDKVIKVMSSRPSDFVYFLRPE